MGLRHLEALGVDSTRARRRLDFLDGYAAMLRESTTPWQREIEVDQPSLDNREVREVAWAIEADLASTLTEAAGYSMLVSPGDSIQRLLVAGDAHWRLGRYFGLYLRTVALGDDIGLAEEVPLIVELVTGGDASRQSAPSATRPRASSPQDLAYGILALAFLADPLSPSFARMREFVDSSYHRRGVTPVGQSGTPIHRHWACARALLGRTGPETVIDQLSAMASIYTEQIELARVNRHLWEHVSAPLDLVDLDILGIVAFAARRFGSRDIIDPLVERVSLTAANLIDLAREMIAGG